MKSYVLISAARNEESFIERTLKSVISQTVLPKKWIIVSDGSTDRTDEIVNCYAQKHHFIQLIRSKSDVNRNFGSKAKAVQHGYSMVKELAFDFIGNLDADISFEPDYYQKMLDEFLKNKNLGIVGGIRFDLVDGKFRRIICSRNSVGGGYQFFRRACFEEVGGYRPMPFGGIDAVAEITAQMKGWNVRSFPQHHVYHYRRTGMASFNSYQSNFRFGVRNYVLGYHPVFQLSQCIFRGIKRRNIIDPTMLMIGYAWAFLRQYQRPLPDEFVKFLRSVQMIKLRTAILKLQSPSL